MCVKYLEQYLFICIGRVSCISGWPPASYVVEDDQLRTSDSPASTSHMLGLELYATTPSLFGVGDAIQGPSHSRRAFYQLSYSPSPCVVHLWKYKVGLLKSALAFWDNSQVEKNSQVIFSNRRQAPVSPTACWSHTVSLHKDRDLLLPLPSMFSVPKL